MTTSRRMTSTRLALSCAISLLLEIADQHLTNAGVVVDDQNMDGLFCRLDH